MKGAPIAVLLALVALAANAVTVVTLLGVRSLASARLQEVSTDLRGLAAGSIETVISVRQTLQLDADIRIVEPTAIDLTLNLADKVPIRLDVSVKETLKVPLDVPIDQMIDLDTAMTITDKAKIRIKADIKLDQGVRWRVANPFAPLLNIEGNVPLDQDVEISFPQALMVKGQVPVKFRLQDEIEVPVAFEVPVEQMMDLKLAIKQQAQVGFPEPLHIVGDIPVVLEIPVSIPLQPTPVGHFLEKVAGRLESLLGW
jgi:hypothetical protein